MAELVNFHRNSGIGMYIFMLKFMQTHQKVYVGHCYGF